jgi:hypothetical protein
MSKRYVLFQADSDLSEEDVRAFTDVMDRRHKPVKVISVKGNPRALIVKTTNAVAPKLRGDSESIAIGGKKLVTVLTSGAIVNLKKRASGAKANGKVP